MILNDLNQLIFSLHSLILRVGATLELLQFATMSHYEGKEASILMLSEWIRHEIARGKIIPMPSSYGTDPSNLPASARTSLVICSDNYLMLALRLAYSLVDQICKEEGDGKSPTMSNDWVDNIVVRNSDTNECNDAQGGGHLRRDSLDSLGFPTYYDSENPLGEVNDDFFSNIFDSDTNGGSTRDENERNVSDGTDCIRAELSPPLFYSNGDHNLLKDVMQRIYRLGEVFHVIFSGGERSSHRSSSAEMMGEKISAGYEIQIEALPQQLFEDVNPSPFDQDGPIDPAGGLGIFDNIEDHFAFNQAVQHDKVADIDEHHIPMNKRAQMNNESRKKRSYIISVEPLREKGLPTSLCDLVFNMFDCINYSLSGEDAYQSMSDVRSDLRLMLDQPQTFLHDQAVIISGTQFIEGTMFGRNTELSTIKDIYCQSVSDKCGLVTISGQSGTGKSLLAYEFGKYVVSGGGIFLFGKFDQLKQGKPFSALALAFDHYCGMLLQNEALASTREELACQLKSTLGMEIYHLSKIIPNLAAAVGSEMPTVLHDEDFINVQKRVQYLLCLFVEAISSSTLVPITLFLDDLQWADTASIAALNQLLLAGDLSSRKNFFFLGCVRDEDSVAKWLPGVDSLIAGGINIQLDCMNKHTLNTMMSQTLCLSPRLTRTLSDVLYLKTKGNPFFVSRLMRSLYRERLLYQSLSRRRWEWDITKIRSRTLPDDVAVFLTDSLRELPDEVQSALFVLSCFGASSQSAFVEGQGLDEDILENLDIAVAEGLVDKINDQYRFTHDRIQEAAYNKVPAQKRCLIHFQYGLELSSLLTGNGGADDSFLFTAANQLNLGGPAATECKGQKLIASQLNLKAGKKAMEMSDYETAYSYFDNGLSFLPGEHWQEHYLLSLDLHTLATKCALANGDNDSLAVLVEKVVTKAHFFEDKLEVLYFEMCSLSSSLRLAESIAKGRSILSKLGIDVQGTNNVDICLRDAKDLLSGYADDGILNSEQMTDRTLIMAMKFLGKLEVAMTQIMPKSVPYVSFKIIQLSLKHGLNPVSPIGFAFLGSCIAMHGNIIDGYHYAKLAVTLLDKVGSRESAGIVICFCTQVRAYVEPLQATFDFYNEGFLTAMASGDINHAAGNMYSQLTSYFFAGTNLKILNEMYKDFIKFTNERKQPIFMALIQQVQRSIFMLIGTGEEPTYSSEGEHILASNSSVVRSCLYNKAYSSFIFRSYNDMKENIENYFALGETVWLTLFVGHSMHSFYTGLISFWVFRKSREEQWHQRGTLSKAALRRWAGSSQWNFENKWYLLEAENAFSNNDIEGAKTYYEKSIESAKNHKVSDQKSRVHHRYISFYF